MPITAAATLATTMSVIHTGVSSPSAIPIADTREIALTVNTMLDTAPGTALITVMVMMAVAMVTGRTAAMVMAVAMVTGMAATVMAEAMVMGRTVVIAMVVAILMASTVAMGIASRAMTITRPMTAWLSRQGAKQLGSDWCSPDDR